MARGEGGEVYVTFPVISFLFVFLFPFFFSSFCNVQKCKLSLWGFLYLFLCCSRILLLCVTVGASAPNAEMVFESQVNINDIRISMYSFCPLQSEFKREDNS